MSKIPSIATFGNAGKGKSTILNNLFLKPQDAFDKQKQNFAAKQSPYSVTKNVSSPFTETILGTNQKVTVYDTPGILALDTDIEEWFEELKTNLPKDLDGIVWVVNITERATVGDAIIAQAFNLIFDHFDMTKIIIVFTHCDLIEEDRPEDGAKAFFELLNNKIKSKIDTDNLVFFGKENTKNIYNPKNLTKDFAKAVQKISKEGNLAVKDNLDNQALLTTILDGVDKKVAEAFLKEIEESKRTIEEQNKKIADQDEKIKVLLQRKPEITTNNYYSYYTTNKRGRNCNIF